MTIHPIVTLGSEESQGGNDGTTCPDKSDNGVMLSRLRNAHSIELTPRTPNEAFYWLLNLICSVSFVF